VHVGDIALERRRLDLVQRQDGNDERIPAERIAIGREYRTAFLLDSFPCFFFEINIVNKAFPRAEAARARAGLARPLLRCLTF